MKCCRVASCALGLSLAIAFALFVALQPRQGSGHEEDEKDAAPGPAIELPERPIRLAR